MTRRILLRLAWLAAAVVLFYAWDWSPLRAALRDTTAAFLARLGDGPITVQDQPGMVLLAAGRTYAITPDCTYIDLVLILAPFCWRYSRSLADNLGRLTALAGVVLAGNLLRVVAAIHLDIAGVSWQLAHDLPDLVVYWPSLAVAATLALRADQAGAAASDAAAPEPC